jgi:hypothetical protein
MPRGQTSTKFRILLANDFRLPPVEMEATEKCKDKVAYLFKPLPSQTAKKATGSPPLGSQKRNRTQQMWSRNPALRAREPMPRPERFVQHRPENQRGKGGPQRMPCYPGDQDDQRGMIDVPPIEMLAAFRSRETQLPPGDESIAKSH